MNTFEETARAVKALSRIDAVPTVLSVLCEMTGLRFAAVTRVTDRGWTALAVRDGLGLGFGPGERLTFLENLELEVRVSQTATVIEHLSAAPHNGPSHSFESFMSVPIILANGRNFGSLCALDTKAVALQESRLMSMFKGFAVLIASQLEQQSAQDLESAALLDERAAGELREQFIAILGHDLRNPLQAIYAGSDLLQRQLANPAQAQIAARIKTNARRMSALIDDVLDFARGRLGGGIGLELTEVENINTSLATVIQELRDAQPDRQILDDINVNRGVRCDLGRLQQVASNLLGNALTHGKPDSPIRITASNDEREFVLEVWNAGNPIPAESLSKIFEPFWRHSVSASRNGLGLGLHISAQIVRAHQGDITVRSTRENGTNFTVRLPLRLAESTPGVALHTIATHLPIPTSRQVRG
jgi:signal transduction histidine kinase